MEKDREYMMMALSLAAKGKGTVSPNPMVGAVIVRDGVVIGKGWHQYYGGLHAERVALADCRENPAGATMYVTLEPCCHYGKQPPCTDAIIGAGIKRVVVAMEDPNPLVAGKGMEILRNAGIEVECDVCRDEAARLNRIFIKYIARKLPWVVLKSAATMDGRIASRSGDSKWITCEKSREFVHRLRSEHTAIAVGIGTVVSDDPMLNCRLEGGRSPIRVIVDSRASISLDSNIVRTAGEYRTILVHTGDAPAADVLKLVEAGVETVVCRSYEGRVDIDDMLSRLGLMGIDSILLEGGSELNWSFIRSGNVDEVYLFIAPKIIGGNGSKGPVGGEGFERMSDAVRLEIESVGMCAEDILIHAYTEK